MKKQKKTEWFEEEAFWSDMYPFMFPESRFAETADQIAKILKLVNPTGKSVLDLCCGPGRCSVALAQKGFKVTGVDRTMFLLRKARTRARSAKVKVEWVEQDMRDFLRPESFDLVLSVFTSFGYFDDKGEDIRVLENMYANLKPGGICLIDVMGKERIAKILQPVTFNTLPNGTILMQRHEIFDDWTRIRNEWVLMKDGKSKSYKFHHTIYSGQELRDRMERAGFRKIKLYGTLDGAPYDPAAPRLVALGTRPK